MSESWPALHLSLGDPNGPTHQTAGFWISRQDGIWQNVLALDRETRVVFSSSSFSSSASSSLSFLFCPRRGVPSKGFHVSKTREWEKPGDGPS